MTAAPTETNREIIRQAFEAWRQGTSPHSAPGSPGASRSARSPFRGVFSDDDTVVVIWDGRGIANGGQPYQNSYAWNMRLDNGKVVDGTAFFDSIPFNDLWTRVQPS
jgi:hypothetical protein